MFSFGNPFSSSRGGGGWTGSTTKGPSTAVGASDNSAASTDWTLDDGFPKKKKQSGEHTNRGRSMQEDSTFSRETKQLDQPSQILRHVPAVEEKTAPLQLPRAKVSPEDFVLLKVIGKGSYGKVMMVRYKHDNQVYAMKMLRKENIVRRNQVEHTRTERSVLETISHPFIVRLFFAFQTPRKLYFVMEYCPGGELFFHLSRAGRFTEARARYYSAEIVLALEHLHNLDIVYRDLKPENVLLDGEGHVRLTDFGLSKEGVSDNFSARSLCGTPEYLAPEILNQMGHGKAVDWWSLGALIYEMLTGLPPFYTRDRDRLFEDIRRCGGGWVESPQGQHAGERQCGGSSLVVGGDYFVILLALLPHCPIVLVGFYSMFVAGSGELRYPSSLSPAAKSLLTGLFQRDPNSRLGGGPEDADEIKRHSFFANVDWQRVLAKLDAPPFQPIIRSKADVSNFDPDFTKLPVNNSEAPESTLTQIGDELFDGFSYDSRTDSCQNAT